MITLDSLRFSLKSKNLAHQVTCLACDSSSVQLISSCEIKGLTIFETSLCEACAHVYRSIKPNEIWFNEQFAVRHQKQLEAGISPISEAIEIERLERYGAIGLAMKKASPKMGTYLDVGCGPGTGFKAFEELGIVCTGVEPDTSRSSIAKKNGYDVQEVEFQHFKSEQTYDVISMVHSLEHFQDPLDFLIRAKSFAHEDTLLYIEVPEVLDHVQDWNDSLYLAHMSNFNEHSLKILASRAGWGKGRVIKTYENTGLHEGHLCMVFQLEQNTSPERPNAKVLSELKSEIQNRYALGLPSENAHPHVFELPFLNDLSLGFKGSSELKMKVHDNYAQRHLILKEKSRFVISESD